MRSGDCTPNTNPSQDSAESYILDFHFEDTNMMILLIGYRVSYLILCFVDCVLLVINIILCSCYLSFIFFVRDGVPTKYEPNSEHCRR